MQNRYAGDIGDYGKLGLLRQIQASTQLSIGVNWYLVPDEGHNGDGQHINYLTKNSFRECDPPLFDALAQVVASGRRQVTALETPAVLPNDNAVYYSEMLDFSHTAKPEREAIRAGWHKKALAKLKGCDLVFADPDNGLIVPSAEDGPKSSKYVLPSELKDTSEQFYRNRTYNADIFLNHGSSCTKLLKESLSRLHRNFLKYALMGLSLFHSVWYNVFINGVWDDYGC